MDNQLIVSCALFSLTLLFISCSTTDKVVKTTPAIFDAGSYVNPEDYGYDLLRRTRNKPGSVDSAFIPLSYKKGLYYVQSLVEYPQEAIFVGAEGTVILQIYVDSTATMQYINVVQSPSSILTKSSIEAVKQAAFNPATLNGKPVNSYLYFLFVFLVKD